MWSRFRNKRDSSKCAEVESTPVTHIKAQNPDSLLKKHMLMLSKIQSEVSMTEEMFNRYYMSMFRKFAAFCQLAPASEASHHRHAGGLLQHSLEVAFAAAKMRQGVMYTEGGEERISELQELYTFAVVSAALLHDIGKIVTDLEFVRMPDGKRYLPQLGEPLKPGNGYLVRFSSVRRKDQHEKANMAMATHIIPAIGQEWLWSDAKIMRDWLSSVAGEKDRAGHIGEIVAKADQHSTSKALTGLASTSPAAATNKKSNGELIVDTLKEILENEELKLNQPGAAGWITDSTIFLVSGRAADMASSKLRAVGKQLPTNPHQIFGILADEGVIRKTDDGEAIHRCKVVDTAANWEQELTMLVFDRSVLDPQSRQDKFVGKVLVAKTKKPEEPSIEDTTVISKPTKKKKDSKPEVADNESPVRHQGLTEDPDVAEFLEWLAMSFKTRSIDLNKPNAPAHILDGDRVFIVSPRLFKEYLSRPSADGGSADVNNNDIKALQRKVISSKLLEKTFSGDNFFVVSFSGSRRQGNVKGVLFKPQTSRVLVGETIPPKNQVATIKTPVFS